MDIEAFVLPRENVEYGGVSMTLHPLSLAEVFSLFVAHAKTLTPFIVRLEASLSDPLSALQVVAEGIAANADFMRDTIACSLKTSRNDDPNLSALPAFMQVKMLAIIAKLSLGFDIGFTPLAEQLIAASELLNAPMPSASVN